MSVVPSEIPDVGATNLRLTQNPRFDPMSASFGAEEYFVWTRFDGTTSLKDLLLMTGLPIDRGVAIVRALRKVGAILLPGEKPEEALERAAMWARVERTDTTRATTPLSAVQVAAFVGDTARSQRLPPVASGVAQVMDPNPEEQDALAEVNDLSDEERRRILGALRLVDTQDPWIVLGLARGTDKRTLKRAFFERSKMFHPDRYYGRRLGTFAARLHAVFEAITRAHTDLTDDRARAPTAAGQVEASTPQTPGEYAAELFERACDAEVSGDAQKALKLFAAVLKVDGQARYFRRAATCALTAGDLYTALDHAQKAAKLEPNDPSIARMLAKVLRGLGRMGEAEEILVMALAMKNDNDVLVTELAADLRSLRHAMER